MKIKVKVHSNSSMDKMKMISEGNYEVWVKEKPIEGKANIYLEKFLKKEFGKKCRIVSGFSSKMKVFELLD
ncbi:MAG: DUF167 domain-containing protein [Nanoarchaeota archaeon]|jgi:uncharacterized protein (TIGR00251 family)|nr:DUF167 domain-containing protein [Nanoarchaeota archaeon]